MNNYDTNIHSVCSPQTYEIFTSKECMNSPFLEFYKHEGTTAYDINKQYTNIFLTVINTVGLNSHRQMKLKFLMVILILVFILLKQVCLFLYEVMVGILIFLLKNA